MKKKEQSIAETMQNIKRIGDCLIASLGYKSWRQIPKIRRNKNGK